MLIPGKNSSRFGRRGSAIGIGTVEEVVARGVAGSGGCLHALFSARSQDGGHIGDVGFLSSGQAQGCAGWRAGSSDGTQHLLWGLVPAPEPVTPARGFWPCPGHWNSGPVPARIWYPKTLCPAARPPISLVLHKAPSLSSALTPSPHREVLWGLLRLHTPLGPIFLPAQRSSCLWHPTLVCMETGAICQLLAQNLSQPVWRF